MNTARRLVVVLFARSGVMRAAFEACGWEALEVDAQPGDVPGAHWQGDVFEFLTKPEFRRAELVILHPPCTYLASSGLHWNAVRPGREMCSRWALEQTGRLFAALRGRRYVPAPRLWHPGRLVEWPPGSGRHVRRWGNQTDAGQDRHSPTEARAGNRARTYPGIARAIARQATEALAWELPLERSCAR